MVKVHELTFVGYRFNVTSPMAVEYYCNNDADQFWILTEILFRKGPHFTRLKIHLLGKESYGNTV